MRVDARNSQYREAVTARGDFTQMELRRCRLLLRRLHFLEKQIAQRGGLRNGGDGGGAGYVEWELEALEWALTELGFLEET